MCSYNWACEYLEYIEGIPHPSKLKKAIGRNSEFDFGNQESRESARAIVSPIFVGDKFRPSKVRLVGGDSELHPALGIKYKLRSAVVFGERYFRFG